MHKDSHMGVRGQGRERGGGGAAGISWALHFEAALEENHRLDRDNLSRQTLHMASARGLRLRPHLQTVIYDPLLTPRS